MELYQASSKKRGGKSKQSLRLDARVIPRRHHELQFSTQEGAVGESEGPVGECSRRDRGKQDRRGNRELSGDRGESGLDTSYSKYSL